ncbi:MAG: hypothetical protein ACOCXT_03085 [Candidatus Dojkabacteria bacterium]
MRNFNIHVKHHLVEKIDNLHAAGFYLEKGGMFTISSDSNGILAAVFLDGWFIANSAENQKVFDELLKAIPESLGEPEAQYIDSLYDGLSIDVYFTSGMAFSGIHTIIFQPSNTVDREFVKSLGIDYLRQEIGCTKCER